ncbi:hypothetical protein [Luteibacter sp.]|uniref:hypothetical protein n=1 Tax=Luteibacter sp. TaxID=1886636 RepID=UPI0025C6D581|nr:hypothetical protein [Luteibacter sp.]
MAAHAGKARAKARTGFEGIPTDGLPALLEIARARLKEAQSRKDMIVREISHRNRKNKNRSLTQKGES